MTSTLPYKLGDLFGENASQNSEFLIIDKRGLKGLTPSISNSPESIIAALVLTLLNRRTGKIEDHNGEPITDHLNRFITFDNSAIPRAIKASFWRRIYTTSSNTRVIRDVFVLDFFASPPPSYGEDVDPDRIGTHESI